MLRPFPPKNASSVDLIPYQINSDELLRPVSSIVKKLDEPSPPYDESALLDVSNLSSELLDAVKSSAESAARISASSVVPGFDSDTAQAKAGLQKDIKSGNTSDGFILAMIFKIVPIGVNIARKGKTIVAGLKESSMGIVDLIKNIALLATVIGIDTIEFFVQLFVYLFKLLLCSVTILMNFPKCVIFYVLDIIIFLFFMCIMSIMFIFDMFFLTKYWLGTSLIEMFMMGLGILSKIDDATYSSMSVHIIHYPDSITNMCYTCSAMGDTSGFKRVASRMFNNIFIGIPTEVGGPIGDIFTGISHIFSFFNI
jgi:hypothetical protein